jgi:hypothetical protein
MGKVVKLDHCKSFEMKLRIMLFKRGEQISELTEREFCVESSGNMKFGSALFNCLAGDTQAVIDVMRVSIRLARRAIEAAKLAINVADVGGIEVAVNIEEGCAPVFSAPNAVSQLTKRRQVVCCKKCQSVFKRKSFAGFNLLCYGS